MRIEDGTGKGYELGIDSTNRALTRATTESQQLEGAKLGKSYQIGSGHATLTSANDSALIYIKNNEDDDLVINALSLSSGAMTGATPTNYLVTIYANSTGLSTSTPGGGVNNNFGSNRSLATSITIGAEAATVTGGNIVGQFYVQSNSFFTKSAAWVFPKGATLAVSIQPATGNTSFSVGVIFEAYLA